MKLVLISPKGPLYRHRGGIFKKSLRYAPLTLTTLAALVPPELAPDIEIRLFDEGIEDVDLDLEADLVGMTVITGSAMRAYELAAHFRSRGIPVVLGGPHITLIPDDAAPHADAIVVGYAEDTWPELLRDFAAGKMKARPLVVPKTFGRSASSPLVSAGKADDRWSSCARSIARRIRSGTFVGPGTKRKLRPDMLRLQKKECVSSRTGTEFHTRAARGRARSFGR